MAKHAREPRYEHGIISCEHSEHAGDSPLLTPGQQRAFALVAARSAIESLHVGYGVPLEQIAVTFSPIGESFSRGVRAKAHAVPKPSNLQEDSRA